MLKLFALICLIVLAGFGIGLTGGIPISSANKRKDPHEINTELIDYEESESQTQQSTIKQK